MSTFRPIRPPPNFLYPATGINGVSTVEDLSLRLSPWNAYSGTHASTDWECRTAAGGGGSAVWSSIADAVNKVTNTIPSGTLSLNTTYYLRARMNTASTSTPWSRDVVFTTSKDAVASALEFISSTGQSNNETGGGDAYALGQRAVTTTPPYPANGLMFYNATFGLGGTAEGANYQSGFVASYENADVAESHGTSMMRFLIDAETDAGDQPGTYVYRTHGWSGQLLSAISQGTVPYNNGLVDVQAAHDFRLRLGRNRTVVYVQPIAQGEADAAANTPRATYAAQVLALQSDWETNVQAITGQTEPVWLVQDQLTAPDGASRNITPITFAQVDAMTTGPSVAISCCPYFLPFAPNETVHWAKLTKAILGEYRAKAYYNIREAVKVNPAAVLGDFETCLRPNLSAIARVGTTITVPLLGAVGSVVIDTTTLPDAGTGKGFSYTGAAITNVAIVGTDVVITIASSVGGTLRYAYEEVAATTNSMPDCWGNIRDSDPTASIADPGRSLYNWLITFDSVVT